MSARKRTAARVAPAAPDNHDRLRDTLQETLHGQRKAVLVLGDGLNRQQSRGSAEWQQLLAALYEECGGEAAKLEAAGSAALQWLLLLRQWTDQHECSVDRAESLLKAALCARLTELERGAASARSLYGQIVGAGCAHIVSFNLDRRIIAHLSPAAIEEAARTSFLDCMIGVRPGRSRSRTAIWFPYGTTADAASIELGHASYDARLMAMEDYRHGMMERWYDWSGDYSTWEMQSPNTVYWSRIHRIRSWFDLFFIAPLIFVGVSLSPDDWPLWWLLHQRARNFAAFPDDECPPTFYLTTDDADTTLLAGGTAGIELVSFATHAALWRFLRAALRPPRGQSA